MIHHDWSDAFEADKDKRTEPEPYQDIPPPPSMFGDYDPSMGHPDGIDEALLNMPADEEDTFDEYLMHMPVEEFNQFFFDERIRDAINFDIV